ncbi:MAG: hypothetical protein ACI89X_001423 [Planctomycetota bacterium]
MLNARFVPVYFDLGRGSPAADKDARNFVVKARKEFGGRSVSTPPVLIMTTDGEVVAEISNYATEAEMLRGLRKVLKEHPQYAGEAAAEAKWSRLKQARVQDFLGNDGQVMDLLGGVDGRAKCTPEETLFLAQVARRGGSREHAVELLDSLPVVLANEVAMEKALLSWTKGDFAAMVKPLTDYPKVGARAAEAAYYAGLAQFHLGEAKRARATWKQLVKAHGDNRWSYRADWAYTQTTNKGKAKQRRAFTTVGNKSLLGRHGYMGRQNPDLAER